jgi:hypothetical protein
VAAIYHPERSQRALLNLTTPETYWMNWGLWEDGMAGRPLPLTPSSCLVGSALPDWLPLHVTAF